MREALTLFLFGCGIGALGLVQDDMYVVGSVIVLVALIGVLVRIGYRFQRLDDR